MVDHPLFETLARSVDQVFRFVSGRPPRPPEFDGLLDELFTVWPEDEEDAAPEARRVAAA